MQEQDMYNEENINSEEQYLDSEDLSDQQERMEDQIDDVENVEWADVPQARKQESLYTLFNKVLRSKDNSKVANLDKYELGPQPFMNVRNSQFLALLGTTVKHDRFAQFFYSLSEITLKTSASKKGWFTELFVSQKKSTSRFSGLGGPPNPQQFGDYKKKRRFNIFGGNADNSVESSGGG